MRVKEFETGKGRIPAHAGKTRSDSPRTSIKRAHPRSRGENRPRLGAVAAVGGASPLTRGKPAEWDGGGRCVGRIPAHAGKTGGGSVSTELESAHPRSRGENPAGRRSGWSWWGASPLTRGKRDVDLCLRGAHGRIPAHAGKTSAILSRRSTQRAHPRSRGENKAIPAYATGGVGASPLTRGKQRRRMGHHSRRRRIPAHAGKTHATGY